MPHDEWPPLEFAAWAQTKRSLQSVAQMLGKLRLALSPHQPNFTFTALALTPRGFTTGLIPYGLRGVQASLDVFAGELHVEASGGETFRVALGENVSIAGVFAALLDRLAALGIAASLSPIPQETADVTPFDRDERPAAFDPRAAQDWLRIVTATSAIFDRWRAHFSGRMGIYLWWGGFDLSLMLFNGKSVPPPLDRGYLIKYDLDAELMNVGFYPGDQVNPAIFYGYIYPQPAGCEALPIAPPEASWSESASEWILPYEALRASAEPEALLVTFLNSIYDSCGSAAGWDRAALGYAPPPLRRAR